MGLGISVWVIVNTNLNEFQWQLFKIIRVLYEYDLYLYESFMCGFCFSAVRTSKHIVLLIYTARRGTGVIVNAA